MSLLFWFLMGGVFALVGGYLLIGHTPSYDERQKQRPRDG